MGDKGLVELSLRLPDIRRLQSLDLRNNRIGNEGCFALKDSLHHLHHLKSLQLGVNSIGNGGSKAIIQGILSSPSCFDFQELNLEMNKINDIRLSGIYTLIISRIQRYHKTSFSDMKQSQSLSCLGQNQWKDFLEDDCYNNHHENHNNHSNY